MVALFGHVEAAHDGQVACALVRAVLAGEVPFRHVAVPALGDLDCDILAERRVVHRVQERPLDERLAPAKRPRA